MTYEQIIKGLECCCLVDPKTIFLRDDRTGEIITLNMNDVFYLINRQHAEIERLKGWENLLKAESHAPIKAKARAEAIKEFAEKLNDRIVNFPSVYPIESATLAFLNGSSHRQLEILEIINNLVKETVGDTE